MEWTKNRLQTVEKLLVEQQRNQIKKKQWARLSQLKVVVATTNQEKETQLLLVEALRTQEKECLREITEKKLADVEIWANTFRGRRINESSKKRRLSWGTC